jgi:histidinol phosphatase-like PHP family hydrolase
MKKQKTIIKENINNYIFYLENFFKKLNSLKNEDINELFKEIDFIFLEFDKNTKIGYQKITILIGKEIAAIKKEIKDFSKEIMKLFNENKSKINF